MNHSSRLITALAIASMTLSACASLAPSRPGEPPVLGRERLQDGERYFVLDTNDIVVVARERSAIAPVFLALDEAQWAYQRYLQKPPPRTAVVLIADARDSLLLDHATRTARAERTIWTRVETPPRERRRRGPRPLATPGALAPLFEVVRGWIRESDSESAARPLPDWIVVGLTQLITGRPSAEFRDSQLAAQASELLSLDSLQTARIPMVPPELARAAVDPLDPGLIGPPPGGGGIRIERAPGSQKEETPPPRVERPALTAMQAASVLQFMWAREGRWILKELVQAVRRGAALADVLRSTPALPDNVDQFEVQWRTYIGG